MDTLRGFTITGEKNDHFIEFQLLFRKLIFLWYIHLKSSSLETFRFEYEISSARARFFQQLLVERTTFAWNPVLSTTRLLFKARAHLKCCTRTCIIYLWSLNVSPSVSGLSVPDVAKSTVVSRSLTIPWTALTALIQAWVPREPAWRAARTFDTYYKNIHNNNIIIIIIIIIISIISDLYSAFYHINMFQCTLQASTELTVQFRDLDCPPSKYRVDSSVQRLRLPAMAAHKYFIYK